MHFFLATATRARGGDGGAFITSSEWLDTNYGRLVRELLLGHLGGEAIHVLEPTATPFDDAAVTAAITCFRVGRPPGAGIRMRRLDAVSGLGALEGGREVPAGSLGAAPRWSPLTRARPRDAGGPRPARRDLPGASRGRDRPQLHLGRAPRRGGPARVGAVRRASRAAREIFEAGPALSVTDHLRRVVDLPHDLDVFEGAERRSITRFLRDARRDGAHDGYIARARRAWWSVGLRPPAPILATYMARRPPAFVRNEAGARHINIAHGLYPRTELPDEVLDAARERAAAERLGGRRPHLRRRAHQVRAARDGAAAGARPLPRRRRGGMSAFLSPPRWSPESLERDVAAAVDSFRRERGQEPLGQYPAHVDECLGTMEELIELTVDLSQLRERAVEVVTEPRLLEALRFVAGPFISVDDLRVIARTTLAPTRLRADPEAAARIVDSVLTGIDRRRFAWVHEGREPGEAERQAAVLASATLMATERMRTLRRNDAKTAQEGAVAQALIAAGFTRVERPRAIRTLEDAPAPGEFCDEVDFGGRKADLVVGLWDRRRMPLECKVSNSMTNSFKRVNNDAAVKAVGWLRAFGEDQVVPAAVLSGVFKAASLESAQARGLTVFWAHRLDDLVEWIERTRP